MVFLTRQPDSRTPFLSIVVIAGSVLLALALAPAAALPTPLPLLPASRALDSVPFQDGEHVRYEVNWKALPILPAIRAGFVDFHVVQIDFKGLPAYRISARVRSAGILASMGVNIQDDFESIVEARTFRSLHFVHRIRTNKKERDLELDVDYEARRAILVESNVEDSPPVVIRRKVIEDLPDRIADVVSVFYAGRLIDLQEEQTYFVNLHDNGEIKRIQVTVERREQVRSLLESHQTFRLRAGEGIFREGQLLVWYERDHLKLPVRFEANVPLGKVFGQLALFESPHLTKARVKVAAHRAPGKTSVVPGGLQNDRRERAPFVPEPYAPAQSVAHLGRHPELRPQGTPL